MTRATSYRIAVLVCAAVSFSVGCGDSAKTGPGKSAAVAPPAPAAMQSLVPEGTVGIVHIPNLKALEDDVNRLASASEISKPPARLEIGDLAQTAGIEGSDLDLANGAMLAVTMPAGGGQPGLTAIVPVRDAKATAAKVRAKNPQAAVDSEGSFAAVAIDGAYKRGGLPAKLGDALPAADVVVRLDMATLGRTLGPMLMAQAEEGLQAAGENAVAVTPMLEGLKKVLDESATWTLAVRIEGTAVEIDLAMDFVNGGKATLPSFFKKADLAALAKAVPDGGAMQLAAGFDPARMIDALSGMMTAALTVYPEEQRAPMQKMFDSMKSVAPFMGPGAAISASLSPGGMEMTGVIESSDPGQYVKVMSDIFAAPEMKGTFMVPSTPEDRTVEGTKVRTLRVKVDAEKLPEQSRVAVAAMYGKDGLQYNFADLGKRLLMVMGNDDRLTGALKAAKASSGGAFSKAVAAEGSDTVGYMSIDMRAIMQWALGMMQDAAGTTPKPPAAGAPVPITIVMNAGPSSLRTRMSLDWGKFMKLMEESMPK